MVEGSIYSDGGYGVGTLYTWITIIDSFVNYSDEKIK